MKYTAVALLFLGVISTSQAVAVHETNYVAESSGSDDDAQNVQLNDPCEYLDETQEELDYQVDMFSRTLDPRHWTNVLNIAKAMKKKQGKTPRLQVHTWELYDKSFSFPRVRRYNFVGENMDMLEHF